MARKLAKIVQVQRKSGRGRGFQVTVPVEVWKELKLRHRMKVEVTYDPEEESWTYTIR